MADRKLDLIQILAEEGAERLKIIGTAIGNLVREINGLGSQIDGLSARNAEILSELEENAEKHESRIKFHRYLEYIRTVNNLGLLRTDISEMISQITLESEDRFNNLIDRNKKTLEQRGEMINDLRPKVKAIQPELDAGGNAESFRDDFSRLIYILLILQKDYEKRSVAVERIKDKIKRDNATHTMLDLNLSNMISVFYQSEIKRLFASLENQISPIWIKIFDTVDTHDAHTHELEEKRACLKDLIEKKRRENENKKPNDHNIRNHDARIKATKKEIEDLEKASSWHVIIDFITSNPKLEEADLEDTKLRKRFIEIRIMYESLAEKWEERGYVIPESFNLYFAQIRKNPSFEKYFT